MTSVVIANNGRHICRAVLVRGCHSLITLAITGSLLLSDTDLRSSLSRSFSDARSLVYVSAYFCLVLLSLIFYFTASCIDPGYVPLTDSSTAAAAAAAGDKSDVDEEADDDCSREMLSDDVKHRHCGFCDIDQPLRARHCEDCARCVRRFDHHCPWIDSCVGEFNHRYFLAFLATVAAAIVWSTVIVCRSIQLSKGEGDAHWSWLTRNLVYFVDVFVLALAGLAVVPLTCSHLYIAASNTTSWEFTAGHRITYLMALGRDPTNPFHRGYWKNCAMFLCVCRTINWDTVYRRYLHRRSHTSSSSSSSSSSAA